MSCHADFTIATGIPVYFCGPHAPAAADPTRTPTGCCASTCRKAPTCRCTRPTSPASPPASTTAREDLGFTETIGKARRASLRTPENPPPPDATGARKPGKWNPPSSCRSWLLIPRRAGQPEARARSVGCLMGAASLGDSREAISEPLTPVASSLPGHSQTHPAPQVGLCDRPGRSRFPSRQLRPSFASGEGLGLKDGPGSARAATVSAWLRQGFILSPSARTGQARYPEGVRRREDEPTERCGAYAPISGR